MKKQLDIFFTALMFLTRLPVPRKINHDPEMLQKSARYFSWVGLIAGIIASGSWLAARQLFSIPLSIFISMIASVITTGAFHEDGFADTCDAFGGGWTKEKILLIMKDSRLGTYGVIGLIAILPLKFLLLCELSAASDAQNIIVIMIAANTISRFTAVTMMQQYHYVGDRDTSKSKPLASRRLLAGEMAIALAGGLLPFLFIHPFMLIALLPVAITRLWLGKYFHKWIGGYTGDCLGAVQQLSEIAFYMGVVIIWKFT